MADRCAGKLRLVPEAQFGHILEIDGDFHEINSSELNDHVDGLCSGIVVDLGER
ncbi:MAG: hypothetical protein AAF497_24430 [Planctomycetota bacterium]